MRVSEPKKSFRASKVYECFSPEKYCTIIPYKKIAASYHKASYSQLIYAKYITNVYMY